MGVGGGDGGEDGDGGGDDVALGDSGGYLSGEDARSGHGGADAAADRDGGGVLIGDGVEAAMMGLSLETAVEDICSERVDAVDAEASMPLRIETAVEF